MSPSIRSLLALPLVLCAACASSAPVPDDPARAFAALERRLLDAPSVHVVSHLTAEGAVEAELETEHLVARDGTGFLHASGTLAGHPVDVRLEFDGKRMRLTGAGEPRDLPQPRDLRGGLLLGLTRMGWLHNVVQVISGNAPEGTDGHVRELARPVHLLAGETLRVEGREQRALTFGVEVKGELAASAVLWLDVESGRPLERWQRVRFPAGEMRVIEEYERFELGPETEPDDAGR